VRGLPQNRRSRGQMFSRILEVRFGVIWESGNGIAIFPIWQRAPGRGRKTKNRDFDNSSVLFVPSCKEAFHTVNLNARSPLLSIKGRLTLKASSCILDSETGNKALRTGQLAAAPVFAFGIVNA